MQYSVLSLHGNAGGDKTLVLANSLGDAMVEFLVRCKIQGMHSVYLLSNTGVVKFWKKGRRGSDVATVMAGK